MLRGLGDVQLKNESHDAELPLRGSTSWLSLIHPGLICFIVLLS